MAAAKEKSTETPPDALSARANPVLFGHEEIEARLFGRYGEGKLPHALLFTGPKGIGKATLAFRLARTLLAEGKASPAAEAPAFDLFGAPAEPATPTLSGFGMAEDHPVFRRVAAGSHADLLTLVPEAGKSESSAHEIRVEAVREVAGFLSMTPAEGLWRIVIIDEAEQMNPNAANALLKLLEEPPARAMLLLVSHQPGVLLPTIRSRCQRVRLHPPNEEDFTRILTRALPPETHLAEEKKRFLFHASRGAPGLALLFHRHEAPERYRSLLILLKQLTDESGAAGGAFSSIEALASSREGEAVGVTLRLIALALERIARVAALHGLQDEAPLYPGEEEALSRLAARMPLDSWLALWENSSAWLRAESALHFDRTQLLTLLLNAMAGHARLPAFAA